MRFLIFLTRFECIFSVAAVEKSNEAELAVMFHDEPESDVSVRKKGAIFSTRFECSFLIFPPISSVF